MQNYSIEYLIMHENEMDWDKISSDRDDWLSLVEIRLFRKRINWKKYLINHINQVDTNMLEIASKYFNKDSFEILESFGIATEEFILNHIEKFNIETVLRNCLLSEDAIFQLKPYWENKPNINSIFKNAKKIDLDDPQYSQLKLYLETKD